MIDEFTIAPVRGAEALATAMDIRQCVFVEEQDCPPEEEWDAFDDISRHFLGYVAGRPVATARWRAAAFDERVVAKLERFAVEAAYRGRGYGRALVRCLMKDARKAGFDDMLLNAQARLGDFYADFGFRTTGHRFMEAGIPHVEMVLLEE